PQILKLLAFIVVMAILLPFFLFLSLVNTTFQFPSVDDPTITQMTQQAIFVSRLYDQFGSFTRQEADAIIARLSAGYDDVVVTENFGNTNNYWLIAISSVLHEQDLYRISENTVRQLVRDNIEYSYWVEVYDDSDEDEPPCLHERIYIDLWDIGQEALMQKQRFDTFKTEWTRFLYGNLMDSQLIDPNNPGYTGDMPGVDYGDLSFTDGGREVIYYNQMDKRWCNDMYGNSQTIGYGGCGPTAMAIVVSSLTDTPMNPKEMADWAYENGYCCEGNGSYHSLIPGAASAYGLSVQGAGRGDEQKIIDALADGKLVVAIMGPGHFTTSGHFIVLRGVTENGQFLVADPVSYGKSQQAWDSKIVFNEARKNAAAGGPFWIIG
ncbi:MAG: C39 family peptidase, partial [Angelakisella sp.]